MLNAPILFAAAILLTVLLYQEKQEHFTGILATKTPLSLLFIVAALVQPHPDPGYFRILMAGLLFCLGGDVFLALRGDRMFRFGLISFLTGHLFYVGAFFYLAGANGWTFFGLAAVLLAGIPVYRWLAPHLGSMKGPVVLYILVISVMLCGAFSVVGTPRLPAAARAVVFSGAVLFYVSDIFVARQRFVKDAFFNRLIGLPLYYAGQFLLAFSVGLAAVA